MKKYLFLISFISSSVAYGQTYTYDVNGDGIVNIEDVTCLTNHILGNKNFGEHDYVEIGGLKWATMNLGATTVADSPETAFGDYYAWGATTPLYSDIVWTEGSDVASLVWKEGMENGYVEENTPYYENGTYTKYTYKSKLYTLESLDDAAKANWGENWRTPTKEEFSNLIECCNGGNTLSKPTESITEGGVYFITSGSTIDNVKYGVSGALFVCAEDVSKRVFFPAADLTAATIGLSSEGLYGFYWSASLIDTNRAYSIYFYNNDFVGSCLLSDFTDLKVEGMPIRPVSDK